MTTLKFLVTYSHFNATGLLIALLLTYLHLRSNPSEPGTKPAFLKLSRKSPLFFSAILLILIVTISPLQYLGHLYLFSAHMVSHVVLLLIVPPMLVNGMSVAFWEKIMNRSIIQRAGKVLFNPAVSWMAGVGSMWIMHIPAVYNTLGKSPVTMSIQMILLLVLGTIFIWPVYSPTRWKKLGTLESSLYLFTACVGCTVLGIFLVFTPFNLYDGGLVGQDSAILMLIHGKLGITPTIDQQIGGLIMWVPACFVYLTNIIVTMVRWFNAPENEEVGQAVFNANIAHKL